MSTSVDFIDRESGEVRREVILGERWLRRAYETWWGRWLWPAISWPAFSMLHGWRMSRPSSRKRIAAFVAVLEIDPEESERRPEEYESLDAFFCRRLRPERRPIATDPDLMLSPADCRLVIFSGIDGGSVVPVKGERIGIAELLDDAALAAEFEGGDVVSCRLCPSDYHRFHFPAAGLPSMPRSIYGRLYSVNPIAIAAGLAVFTKNRRVVVTLDDSHFGKLAIVEVGATCVGRIEQTYTPGKRVAAGDEMGAFHFGGSSLLVLVQRGRVRWDADLLAAAARGLETLVKFGSRIGMRADSHLAATAPPATL